MVHHESIQGHFHQNIIRFPTPPCKPSLLHCHVLIAYPCVHLINSKWHAHVLPSQRTILRPYMRICNVCHRLTWSMCWVLIIVTEPLQHEQPKPSTVLLIIDLICLHVKKRVHEWICHEITIEVFIHAHEVLFASPEWPIFPFYFLFRLLPYGVLFGQIFANGTCFKASFADLLWCFCFRYAKWMCV